VDDGAVSSRLVNGIRRIRWTWVVGAAFLSEVAVLGVFFLLLLAATLAGAPEIAKPMSTLDNVDALVSSFVVVFLFALWVGKRVESEPVLQAMLYDCATRTAADLNLLSALRRTCPSWPRSPP
jgi:uncharacterized membrane protein